MKKQMIKKSEILRRCSGNFLVEEFPDNLAEMSAEEILDYIEERAWGDVEHRTKENVCDLIVNDCDCWINFLTSKGIEVDLTENLAIS
jgi:hypothetical protein